LEGDLITPFDLQYIKDNQPLPPPEIDKASIFTKEMDIWCLGVAIYKICMGYKPYIENKEVYFRK